MVIWTTWPLKCFWGGLTFLFTSANSPCCSHWHDCRWRATKLPHCDCCSGKRVCTPFALGRSAQKLLSVSEKSGTLNCYCDTCFTNTITKWDISAVWKCSKSITFLSLLSFSCSRSPHLVSGFPGALCGYGWHSTGSPALTGRPPWPHTSPGPGTGKTQESKTMFLKGYSLFPGLG